MVVHAHFPLGEPRVQREARAVREAGYDVTVVCLRNSDEPRREVIDGLTVVRLPVSHQRGASLLKMIVEYLTFFVLVTVWLARETIARPFAVVHFHNPPDFLIFAGLVPRLRGFRLVLDVHDLSPHMFGVRVPGALGRLASRLLLIAERMACRLADQVMTVHKPYRAELVRHGVSEEKVQVVMNSVDRAVLSRAAWPSRSVGDRPGSRWHITGR